MPGEGGVQVSEYGAVVSMPSEVFPLKNWTLWTMPFAPPRALSVAVAVRLTGVDGRMAVPVAGESRVRDGGGFVSIFEPPVITSE